MPKKVNFYTGTTSPSERLETGASGKKSFEVRPSTDYVSLLVDGVEAALDEELKKVYKFFDREAGISNNLFEQPFADVNTCMYRYGNDFAGFRVNESKMAAFLAVFCKTSVFKSAHEFLGGNNRNLRH